MNILINTAQISEKEKLNCLEWYTKKLKLNNLLIGICSLLKKTIFLLILLSLFYTVPVNSQDLSYIKFKSITADDGLIGNTVTSIAQDKKGFLWFGTYNGLSRYDGVEFKNFNHSVYDSASLITNAIKKVFIDSKNNLWIGCYNGGLNKYNREKENFQNFYNPYRDSSKGRIDNVVISICEDKNGILWIGTERGLESFDTKSNKFLGLDFSFIDSPDQFLHKEVFDTYIDNDGDLLVGTYKDFGKYNTDAKKFIPYISNLESRVCEIFQHSNGNYWIGTARHGIIEYSIEKGILNRYPAENKVDAFFEDNNKNLWIGMLGGGVIIIDESKKIIKRLESLKEDPNSLSNGIVYCIYKDETNVVWIGTEYGINRYNIAQKNFRNIVNEIYNDNSLKDARVSSIDKDIDGNFWIGYWGSGISKADKDFKNFTHYQHNPNNPNSLANDLVRQLMFDSKGNLWILTDGDGVVIFDTKRNKFYNYNETNKKRYFPDNHPYSIIEDSDGNILIGSWQAGIVKCNLDPNYNIDFEVYNHDSDDTSSISYNVVVNIFEDINNKIWISTKGGGLNKIIKQSDNSIKFDRNPLIPNTNLKSLSDEVMVSYQDNSGDFWIGTNGEGLQRFSAKNNNIDILTINDGLPSDVIFGISEDSNNNIWLVSGGGISKLNSKDGTILNLGNWDGIISNDFTHNAHFKDNNGIEYYGTNKGIVFFNPLEIKSDTLVPKIVLTNLKIFNKNVEIGQEINGRVILNKSISNCNKIELSYKEAVFALQFAGLHFAAPSKNIYKYRMVGFDKDWQTALPGQQSATYTNLDAGKYTFEVMGANSDGVWNPEACSVDIYITPPFWKTFWFISILLILFAASIVWIFMYRARRIRMINISLEKEVTKRTKELVKVNKKLENVNSELNEFAYIVSHDLKAPLRGISQLVGWITDDYSDKLDSDGKEYITMMNQRVKKMNSLIDGVLKYSRAGKSVGKETNISIKDSVLDAVEFLSLPNNININISENLPTILGDKFKLDQLFQNLIGNAVKYNDKDNCIIDIYAIEKENSFEIYIKDNGPGIEEKYQEQIFGIFQSLGNDEDSTGIGLSIVSKIMHNFSGAVSLKSPNDGVKDGATFILEFTKSNV